MNSRRLQLCFLFFIPILLTLIRDHSVLDLSGWVALGQAMLRSGHILRLDSFSVLPTNEMVYPSYSLSLLYAELYKFLGLKGLCAFHDIVVSGILLFMLYRPLTQDGTLPGSRSTRVFMLLFWLATASVFVARPAMVALIPLVLAYSLVKEKLSVKTILKLLFLQITWVNIHGSFILLPMLLTWELVFRQEEFSDRMRRLGTLIASLIVCCLNPFTWKVFPFVFETWKASSARHLSEWQFPSLDSTFPSGLIFWLNFAFWGFYLYTSLQKKIAFRKIIADPYFLILILGMSSSRSAGVANLLCLPAAHSLGLLKTNIDKADATTPDTNLRDAWIGALLFLAVPGVLFFHSWKWDDSVSYRLSDKIKADGKPCPIFNDWNLGSFLMLETKNKIFIDPRNIIYSRSDFEVYESIRKGELGWKERLNQYQVCFVMVKIETAQGLIEKLNLDTDFRLLGNDETYALYTRN